MIDYNFDSRMANRYTELFLKTNNDLQNIVKTMELRGGWSIVPEIRVEVTTPITNANMKKNQLADQIIGSKDKVVMTRNKINEELCLISQVEPKNVDESCKDDN